MTRNSHVSLLNYFFTDQNVIQKLEHELGEMSPMMNTTAHELRAAGDISYMDGFSGMIEEGGNKVDDLVDRAVMVTGASSTLQPPVNATSTMDTCDDETDAPEATPMPSANVTTTRQVQIEPQLRRVPKG